MHQSDIEILAKLRDEKTKEHSFAELIDLYQERLYWHIRKIVITHDNASDVLQNTFIRVYRGIYTFKGKSSLYTWMFRIAYNESIRFVEKNKKRTYRSIDDVNTNYLSTLKQDPYFDGNEVQMQLHYILSEVTEKQRQVFQMKYYDELSFKQISEVTNIAESTLKSSYYTVVKIIEKKITQEL